MGAEKHACHLCGINLRFMVPGTINGKISFGIYACSPEDSSFTAVFTDMQMEECAWKAHDGQKPDEE